MNKLLVSTALVLSVISGAAMAQDNAALMGEGKALMGSFGGALKAELVAAVEAGGPVNAINVCNTEASGIAANAAAGTGWSIGRSSHKLRNPENAADEFTAAAIEDFLARQAAGESTDTMMASGVVEEDGQQVFRMVKAISTGALCLNCHGGDNVAPPVVEKLAELYPDDMARGFVEGEMRGVFTLSKPLN